MLFLINESFSLVEIVTVFIVFIVTHSPFHKPQSEFYLPIPCCHFHPSLAVTFFHLKSEAN